MTAPLTPPHEQPPNHPWQQPSAGGSPHHAPTGPDVPDDGPGTAVEVRQAAVLTVILAAAGVLLGLLWLWLAPRVQLVSNGEAVFLKDTEGEGAVGSDGTFMLLALGFGALSAAAVFLFRRRGGIPLVVGLAVGGLLGSVLAWQLGVRLGPTQDLVAQAKAVGKGVPFESPLELVAKGALLAWPMAALAVHLGLTAVFGPRDPEPQLDWGPPPPPPAARQ
ncbi:AAA family ATPase [Streptomyces sp. A3M-1-3]|uniref:AAA family ATPase n=1 Tax=Streptomyces sp. A3M-1-3 TaxID=2962044 RepID=UPI0020B80DB5|nr:AAA family ATPase [Streptomyces sp. A3M-1-3]MCP3817329.1 AAA family ATPase [Streptomyces sp. A3M-1-3]